MPELPEVETTKNALLPYLLGQSIEQTIVRCLQLRFPLPENLPLRCQKQVIKNVSRRAKYLIFSLTEGFLVIHLGMSGHLRLVLPEKNASKHDHIDLHLSNGLILRYNDARRFGCWLYFANEIELNHFFRNLGPEPLTDFFNAEYLFKCGQNKVQAIKSFIMSNQIVVGIGNIYATESLFMAGIHPAAAVSSLSYEQLAKLVDAVKKVLQQAIEAGGTTLKDFLSPEGKLGYFVNQLQVYGRKNADCLHCNAPIECLRISGRSSHFCPVCQTL